jgi:ferredoxin
MRVVIDQEKCCGHARCNDMAPEPFGLDDLGFAATAGFEVPEGQESRARRAAAACPERAIKII